MMMVTLSCDAEDCDAYEQAPAGIEDGVNIIETEADGWELAGAEQFCPDHRNLADG